MLFADVDLNQPRFNQQEGIMKTKTTPILFKCRCFPEGRRLKEVVFGCGNAVDTGVMVGCKGLVNGKSGDCNILLDIAVANFFESK